MFSPVGERGGHPAQCGPCRQLRVPDPKKSSSKHVNIVRLQGEVQGLRSNVGTVLAHLVPTPLQGGVGTCQQHAQEVLAHGVLTAGSRGVRTHW